MSDKTVTIDQVMAWKPCSEYTRGVVTNLFNGREALTARDIVSLDISAEDRLWALLHPEFLTESEMRLAACDFATAALPLYERDYPEDKRPRLAIEAARAYARGDGSYEDMAAARDAARDAAWDAARAAATAAWDAARDAARDAATAARAAARAAARDAARDAARAAARDAARDAAWDAATAAWAAARDAAWDAQFVILLRYIEGK